MSFLLDLPWGLMLLLLFTIGLILGGGKSILRIFAISTSTFSLLAFLLLGGCLLSPWHIPGQDLYLNFGSLLIPLVLFLVCFWQLKTRPRLRSLAALLIIAAYYLLYQGGYLWKAEQYLPQMAYLFAPFLALVAYLFNGLGKGLFASLAGGVILGDTIAALFLGGPAFQEIFGLWSVNLLLLSLFISSLYYYLWRLPKLFAGPKKAPGGLTDQHQ